MSWPRKEEMELNKRRIEMEKKEKEEKMRLDQREREASFTLKEREMALRREELELNKARFELERKEREAKIESEKTTERCVGCNPNMGTKSVRRLGYARRLSRTHNPSVPLHFIPLGPIICSGMFRYICNSSRCVLVNLNSRKHSSSVN